MPLIRGHHSFDDHFTQIPNDWLRDNRLSFKARGILAMLMSHTQGWSLSINTIAKQNQEGKDAIRSAVQELEKHGYLYRTQVNEGGRFGESIWVTQDPADLPMADNPMTENPTTKNNNIKEEQDIKNNERTGRLIAKKASRLPDDWQPSERLMGMFQTKWPSLDPNLHIENFKLYWKAAGRPMKDWDAAFQKWMNTEESRAKQFSKPKKPKTDWDALMKYAEDSDDQA